MMYLAIVFLPLLGFLLAGSIALIGAMKTTTRSKNSADSDLHHHNDAHGHTDHAVHDHHAAHHAHDEHSHHHEPAAFGSRAAELITTGLLAVSAILSWVAFFQVGFGDETQRIQILRWMTVGALEVDWALQIDTLSAIMLVVVNSVSFLVHLYSMGYMHEDPQRPRFFAYLSLFTFTMLMLVTADNLIQMFFGWEGVGLASYLLIGFWYTKNSANAASMKAFVVNRVGDFGFVLAIAATFVVLGTVSFDAMFAAAPSQAEATITFLGHDWHAMTIICLLFFMGAMGKSAQFLLHTWLPDAMEGPTPVSALIHAATMVTAGIVMVSRLSPLFELAPVALGVITLIGAITAFYAATVGLVQNDIKRVIAYSTCSQLGYMFVALGVGAYSAAFFHLFTHAFFKALLFLGAGSVIHAMHHEQDMRRMGGLRKLIPFTYWTMIIGTIALTGFPFTAGYFSKDAIIEAAYASHGTFAHFAFWATVLAAGMTSFYSWRLIFMTFHGAPRASLEVMKHVHESPWIMRLPLVVLSVGALVAGFVFKPYFIGDAYDAFWGTSLFTGPDNHILHDLHAVPQWVIWSPFVMMVLGFALAYQCYIRRPSVPAQIAQEHDVLYRFLLNKWYFDELYNLLFVRPARWIGRTFWKIGDGKIIDGIGPDGIANRVRGITAQVSRVQTGYLYHYAFAMLIGLTALFTWFIFVGH